jgi:hypothetical protein
MKAVLEELRGHAPPCAPSEHVLHMAAALGMAAAFFLLSALLMPSGAIEAAPSFASIATFAALAVALYYFTLVQPRPTLAVAIAAWLAIFLGLRFAAEDGYAVHFAGRNFSLIDPWLAACDRALGFDWLAMLNWLDRHPWLSLWLKLAYEQCGLLTFVTVVLLAATGRHQRLLTLIGANLLALMTVHAVAFFAPAIGAYGHYGLSPAFHPDIALSSGADTVHHVLALRDSVDLAIPAERLGLVTFPSYHAVLATQFAWALWAIPRVRWYAAGFTGSVLVATVPHGSHYLIDVIAGIGVAAVTLWIVHAATRAACSRWGGAVDEWCARRSSACRGALTPSSICP